MKRDTKRLEGVDFDLAILGGGIFGACAAWDATQRGLRVALIERGDFGGATSANSFKIVHGGIRYLQHGDFVRIRQSSAERRAFLRIAPHLVRPLPVAIPTYGHTIKGKEILRLGMTIYDALTPDRNRGIRSSACRVPFTAAWDRTETLRRFPGLEARGLTGCAVFADAQMKNPPRLVLAFVRSAEAAGATVANYVEAEGFVRDAGRVTGVHARDRVTGSRLTIRARVVLNAAGPYAEQLLTRGLGIELRPRGAYSRDACFVVGRRLVNDALAVLGATSDPDALLSRGERHLFLVPWRQFTLVGVWHKVHEGDPFDVNVTEEEIASYIDEMNGAYPALGLKLEDVTMWNAGLVPFGENEPGARNLKYGHRSRLVDHAATDRIDGLLTLIGVRFTTGRVEAARAVDAVQQKLGGRPSRCRTDSTPVFGGDIADLTALVESSGTRLLDRGIGAAGAARLVEHYGTAFTDVLALARDGEVHDGARSGDAQDGGWRGAHDPSSGQGTLGGELLYGIREEMATTLADLVFRRTDVGTGGDPGAPVLEACAAVAARELGWSASRVAEELAGVRKAFPRFGTRVPVS